LTEAIMDILGFLRKIGILQAGAGAAVYRKAADRPDFLGDAVDLPEGGPGQAPPPAPQGKG